MQVTKDPVGHKGARLTSQISLPGRFLVYVPGGGMTGISRKLPDTERHRLKSILKKIVPEDAGVIIRTAAEGATEDELTRDVERLTGASGPPSRRKPGSPRRRRCCVHGEPDLAIRVVRDVFNEDFDRLVIQGDQAWSTVSTYVAERGTGFARSGQPAHWRRRPLPRVARRRAAEQGLEPKGLPAVGGSLGHRPHRGDDASST